MSCLSLSVKRIGGGLDVLADRVGYGLSASTSRIGGGLDVVCSIVCTANKSTYLYVNPDTLWLTPDMLSNAEFIINSNTSWRIN